MSAGARSGCGLEEHDHDHPQVEEEAGGCGDHADDHQPQVAVGGGGREDTELADESRRGRNAAHGDHQRREACRQERGSLIQPGVVGDGAGPSPRSRDHRCDGECADQLEGIGGQVEPHGRHPVASGDHGGEDVAGVSDTRVGEQPLEVGLGDGESRAEHDRQRSEDRERRGPVLTEDLHVHCTDEDARNGGKPGDLHAGGHQRNGAARRTLVDVRRPLVERRSRHLEAEADDHQRDPGQHDAGLGKHVFDPDVQPLQGDLQRSADREGAVQRRRSECGKRERNAVDEDRRSERAGEEVLHRRLVRTGAVPVEARHHVEADRRRLQGDEHHDEVGRGRHEVHPGDGDEGEGDEFRSA